MLWTLMMLLSFLLKENGSRIYYWCMSKYDAIKIVNNSKKRYVAIFLLCIKMSEKTYSKKNRDVILNKAKDYYCKED